MPFHRLAFILALVIAAAAATVALALLLVGAAPISPGIGLAVLGLLALIAAVIARRFSEHNDG